MNDRNIDVMGLNETRLEQNIPNSTVNISDYKIYRKDRNAAGGGVAIYVRETLPHSQRIDIGDSDLEIVYIEVMPKMQRTLSFFAGICPQQVTLIMSPLMRSKEF